MAALHSFTLFKKYTMNQNHSSRSLLNCVQKMTEPVQREDERDGADNESLASNNSSPDKTTMQMTTIDSYS